MTAKTVLVLEDNPIHREGLVVVLRRAGFNVVDFEEGQAALDYLRAKPAPALILLDMIVPSPGMDGWRFLDAIKKLPALAHVPVVIATSLGVASVEWAHSLGACGLIRKPVDLEPLLNEIRRCVSQFLP